MSSCPRKCIHTLQNLENVNHLNKSEKCHVFHLALPWRSYFTAQFVAVPCFRWLSYRPCRCWGASRGRPRWRWTSCGRRGRRLYVREGCRGPSRRRGARWRSGSPQCRRTQERSAESVETQKNTLTVRKQPLQFSKSIWNHWFHVS